MVTRTSLSGCLLLRRRDHLERLRAHAHLWVQQACLRLYESQLACLERGSRAVARARAGDGDEARRQRMPQHTACASATLQLARRTCQAPGRRRRLWRRARPAGCRPRPPPRPRGCRGCGGCARAAALPAGRLRGQAGGGKGWPRWAGAQRRSSCCARRSGWGAAAAQARPTLSLTCACEVALQPRYAQAKRGRAARLLRLPRRRDERDETLDGLRLLRLPLLLPVRCRQLLLRPGNLGRRRGVQAGYDL